MKKSQGIIVLLITVLLIAGLGYVAIFGIGAEKTGAVENVKLGLDLAGGVSITYQVEGDNPSSKDMSDTIYKLQKRVEGYSTEAQVYQEGDNRINIEIPGVTDANQILTDLGKPGSLYFVSEKNLVGEPNYTYGVNADGTSGYTLIKSIEDLQADGSVVLEGTDVKAATAASSTNDMGTNEYMVELSLTEEGTKKFAEATTIAAITNEVIFIVYDDEIISAPSVQSAITGGQAYITKIGGFEEAEDLASTIRIGGLKLTLNELRSNVVGAQLGSTAIQTSIQAGIIGLAIVILFMCVVYLIPGLASSIALFIYVILMMLMLNFFNITLTLPGIAGIILSIGMAVDANVIIFARVREEIRSGKTIRSSIKIGFQKALSAIIDGNATTLIAAVVLGLMGTGAVKGFAQTLALGIILSMFTALFVTKFILNAFYAIGLQNEKLFGTGKENKPIAFLAKRKLFIAASLVVIICGFVFMGVNKANGIGSLNYSLEFLGGSSTNITFNEDMPIEDLDAKVVPIIEEITGDGNVQTQKVAGTNEVIFKTRTLSVTEREAFDDAMVSNFGVDKSLITAENISSTISSEMKANSIIAVVIATLCMLVYIWFRFKDLRFGASSVLALCHDVLVVLAFYAVARVSVGGTFIACMLTIVGYSINATIVIFDRIRENLGQMKRNDMLEEVINNSITQTLSRSIFTSLTTLIMVVVLYIMGVTSIKEFALPLIVGLVCGCYSSVCLAGSMWYIFKEKMGKKKVA